MGFYLNPPALVNITLLILSLIIFLYLKHLKNKSKITSSILCFFGGISLFLVMFILFNVLPEAIRIWVIPLQYILITVTMIFLIKFVYAYPTELEIQRQESKWAFLVSSSMVLVSIGITINYWYIIFSGTPSHFSFISVLSIITVLQLIWAIVVLCRRTLYLSRQHGGARGIASLLHPEGKDARGTRAFACLFSILLLTALIAALRDSGFLPITIINSLIPLVLLVFYFSFLVVYLNYSREAGSFLVKLVGACLVVVLAFLSIIGYLVFPFWDKTYTPGTFFNETESLRFTPAGLGYEVARIPSLYNNEWTNSKKLNLKDIKYKGITYNLPFPFLYAGKTWKTLYLKENGMVLFKGFDNSGVIWCNYQPAIAPMWGDFYFNNTQKNAGIFVQEFQDNVTFTWAHIFEPVTGLYHTVQLTIEVNGTITFSYQNIKGTRLYCLGLFSGQGYHELKNTHFKTDLPLVTSTGAIIENFRLYYLSFIHNRMLPLAIIVIFATISILGIFPFFFKANLLQPMKALQEGINAVKQGKLSTTLPVRFNDEVGHLTDSFNHMVSALKEAKEGWQEAVKSKDKLLKLNRAILETAAEGIITLDQEGRILSFNKAAEYMFGYNRHTVCGLMDDFLLKENDTSAMGFLAHFRASDEKTRFGVDQQILGKRYDGTFFPLEFSISATDAEDGQIYTVVLHDLTEHQRLAEEKLKLEEQLHQSQKLETIGTLAGGIAHDFNNILTPIIGYAEMSLDSIPPKNEVHGYVQNIINSCYRARDLVKQILTFSRKNELEFKLMELYPIIKGAMALLRASTPSTISFRLELEENCGSIFGDRTQIEQVLMNLCTNATQAMLPEGGTLTVELKPMLVSPDLVKICPALKEDHYILLRVSDTGPGINEEIVKHIFEPFFTTKPVGHGTGLGLSMVQGIVEKHWGAVQVETEIGKGSSFSVYFPAILMGVIEKSIEEDKVSSGCESILLVDDEEIIVEMYEELLQRAGYRVTALSSSKQTLETFRSQPYAYDILITDNTMPELTGVQLSKEVLAIRPDMPIILCTGNYDTLSFDICQQIGIGKLLGKPIFFRTLTQAIRQLLSS